MPLPERFGAHDLNDPVHYSEHTTLGDRVQSASFVVGTETADVINVAIQLLDADGDDLSAVICVVAFLSSGDDGLGVEGSAPDSVSIGTDGAIIAELATGVAWLLQSEADGDIDLDIQLDDPATDTYYLVVVLPTGAQVVSEAITFADQS